MNATIFHINPRQQQMRTSDSLTKYTAITDTFISLIFKPNFDSHAKYVFFSPDVKCTLSHQLSFPCLGALSGEEGSGG